MPQKAGAIVPFAGARQQGPGARILGRVAERLHRQVQHDLVALAAGGSDGGLQIIAIGGKGEAHFAGKLIAGAAGEFAVETHAAQKDGDLRLLRSRTAR